MENKITVVYTFNGKEATYNEQFDGTLNMKTLDTIAWKAGQLFGAETRKKTSGITETVKTLENAA